MTNYTFIPVSRMDGIDEIEICEFKSTDKDFISAFDIRFMRNGSLEVEIDLPTPLTKLLLKKLQELGL